MVVIAKYGGQNLTTVTDDVGAPSAFHDGGNCSRLNDPPKAYLGHTAAVRAISVSPDQKYCLTSCTDGSSRVFRINDLSVREARLADTLEKKRRVATILRNGEQPEDVEVNQRMMKKYCGDSFIGRMKAVPHFGIWVGSFGDWFSRCGRGIDRVRIWWASIG